jgi:hypothetical protein
MNGNSSGDWLTTLKSVDQDYIKAYTDREMHLSFSSLKRFMVSPINFLHYKYFSAPSTKAMDYGTLVHLLLLERDTFKDRYFVIDDTSIIEKLKTKGYTNVKATKDYKEFIAEQTAKNSTKTLVDIELFQQAVLAVKRMLENPDFKTLFPVFRESKKEHVVHTVVNTFPVKMVLDNDAPNHIFDLKVVSDNSIRAIDRSYWNNSFYTYVQQGLYASVYGFQKETVMMYIDNYGDTLIRSVDKAALQYGYSVFMQWLDKFQECLNSGTFIHDSSYFVPVENRKIYIPSWIETDFQLGTDEQTEA